MYHYKVRSQWLSPLLKGITVGAQNLKAEGLPSRRVTPRAWLQFDRLWNYFGCLLHMVVRLWRRISAANGGYLTSLSSTHRWLLGLARAWLQFGRLWGYVDANVVLQAAFRTARAPISGPRQEQMGSWDSFFGPKAPPKRYSDSRCHLNIFWGAIGQPFLGLSRDRWGPRPPF